jgi:uncharacterized iron-regulated membrane protein
VRRVVFWLHLAAGVSAGAVILLMSATGVLLTYEKQMIAWADRTAAAQPPSPDAARLTPERLLAAVQTADPNLAISGLTLSSEPDAPALVTTGTRTVALNAYTGAMIGESAPRLRTAFRQITAWHRWFAVNGASRQTARAITGWATFVFLFILLGGAYLWIPRKWTAAQLRAVTLFRRSTSGKARDFNWHNVIGVWSVVPLLLIVLSALPMSFPWANEALYRAVGDTPPPPQAGPGNRAAAGNIRRGGQEAQQGSARERSRTREAVVATFEGLDPLWARAEAQMEGWRTISVRLTPGAGPNRDLAAPDSLPFTIDRGTGGQPHLRGTLTLDRTTGAVVRWETLDSQTPGRRLRTLARFTHTGEVLGVTGQTIAGLASAGAVVLAWTGISLALRRFRTWRSRSQSPAAVAAVQRSTAA